MSSPQSVRVLVLAQGCGGGIGRIELLLEDALSELSRQGAVVWKSARKARYPTYLTASSNGIGRLQRTILALRAVRDLFSFRPDVVVFTHVYLSPLIIPLRFLRRSVQFATIVYGLEAWERLPWLRRTALKGCDRIWSISNYTTATLEDTNGVSAQRVRLLHLGLSKSQLDSLVRTETEVEPGRNGPVLLTVARLDADEQQKGIDHVIAALPEIRQGFPAVRLVVVGDGTDRPRLERLARKLNVREAVEFAGWLGVDDLARCYQTSDVFALPSAQEGFGLVFLEAMASGLPVVAASEGAAPEVVTDSETGLLVEYGDIGAIARSVCALLADSSRRKRMGERGMQVVRERFTFAQVTAAFQDLLLDLRRNSSQASTS